jgi:hypothetical protein
MPCRNAAIGRSGHAALVLAGQKATGKREIGELAESEALACRKYVVFGVAFDEVVVVLSADESN